MYILWHICSKQEMWGQKNSCCYRMALKQHSFLGNGREADNEMTSVSRQQILNKREQKAADGERLSKHVPRGDGWNN
jgi:hypothetical protein